MNNLKDNVIYIDESKSEVIGKFNGQTVGATYNEETKDRAISSMNNSLYLLNNYGESAKQFISGEITMLEFLKINGEYDGLNIPQELIYPVEIIDEVKNT